MLKWVAALAVIGVACGAAFTVGKHHATGGAIRLLSSRAAALESQAAEAARSNPPDSERAERLQQEGARWRAAIRQIRERF